MKSFTMPRKLRMPETPECPNGHGPMLWESRGVEGTWYRCTGCPARCCDPNEAAFMDLFEEQPKKDLRYFDL